jgi:glycerophosphoryl diester phosphodiesterase
MWRYLCTLVVVALAACVAPTATTSRQDTEGTEPPMTDTNPYRCTTLNIAHRGARSLAPENTLAAARKGLEIGADLWELDVQLTADGEFIVVHDNSLDRTSNVEDVFPQRRPWLVAEFTLPEIRQLDFGSWFNATDPFGEIAAGNVSAAAQESYVGEPAPTLREALQWTKDNGWRVNVELKDLGGRAGEETFVEGVVGLVEELDMVDRVLISSFNHDYLRRAEATNPDIETGALSSRFVDNVADYIRDLGADAYNPKVTAIAPPQIQTLRDQGIDVYVYTVNDVGQMEELVEAGATGIFTDYPQRLVKVVADCRAAQN